MSVEIFHYKDGSKEITVSKNRDASRLWFKESRTKKVFSLYLKTKVGAPVQYGEKIVNFMRSSSSQFKEEKSLGLGVRLLLFFIGKGVSDFDILLKDEYVVSETKLSRLSELETYHLIRLKGWFGPKLVFLVTHRTLSEPLTKLGAKKYSYGFKHFGFPSKIMASFGSALIQNQL